MKIFTFNKKCFNLADGNDIESANKLFYNNILIKNAFKK